jgi:hypothetical protein
MKNSPKWGRAECEIWAPSKRRHHPATAMINLAARPPMSELFVKITAPTLILKADAQGDLRKQNEEVASKLRRGKIAHIQGAGHNVRRENTAQTLEVLRAFLAGLPDHPLSVVASICFRMSPENCRFRSSNRPLALQPEAFLWPPPPNALATTLMSISPFERMLTRQSSGPFSLKNTTAWISLTVSGRLISPSVSS